MWWRAHRTGRDDEVKSVLHLRGVDREGRDEAEVAPVEARFFLHLAPRGIDWIRFVGVHHTAGELKAQAS